VTERVLFLGTSVGGDDGLAAPAHELAGPEGTVAALAVAGRERIPSGPGVERVYEISTAGFDTSRADHLGAAVASAAQAFGATIVLSGPSKLEREGLARAGAVLGAPTITGVRSSRANGTDLEISRDLLSGNATSVERVPIRPALLSMSAVPSLATATSVQSQAPTSVALSVQLPSYVYRRVSVQPKPSGGVSLERAERIVSVGRGLQKKEDLRLITDLAAALGAAVGCTRPIAAESQWLGDDHWVGLTGHRVRPSLYVAVGISGAVQHLAGMRDSKVVVAINRDPNAPIFQQADYQLVGDLYAIVPELTRRLRTSATESSPP
jgi:electron transfer flavoprotein alpha subunit